MFSFAWHISNFFQPLGWHNHEHHKWIKFKTTRNINTGHCFIFSHFLLPFSHFKLIFRFSLLFLDIFSACIVDYLVWLGCTNPLFLSTRVTKAKCLCVNILSFPFSPFIILFESMPKFSCWFHVNGVRLIMRTNLKNCWPQIDRKHTNTDHLILRFAFQMQSTI